MMGDRDRLERHSLPVRFLMSVDPVTVTPSSSVLRAVELMGRHNIGAVVAVEDGRPVGIFTERDLVRRAGGMCRKWHRLPVQEVMTRALHTVSPDERWESALDKLHALDVRHMPVVENGRLVGMLSVRDIINHRTALLESIVTERTTQITRQKQLLEERDLERTRSLEIAGRIQRQLLPARPPSFEPLRLAFAFYPQDQVAGDYYDFEIVGPDTLYVVIGDASGHGIPAALISVIAKTCLRTQMPSAVSPSGLLAGMNQLLYGWVESEHYISMFIASVNRRTLQLSFARAGHPLPLLIHGGSCEVTQLDAGGIMIGVLPDPVFPEQSAQLQPGDKVLLYTDGLTECRSPAGELFGLERLYEVLCRHGALPCDALVEQLVGEAQRFSGNRPFPDDLTILVLEAAVPTEEPGAFGP